MIRRFRPGFTRSQPISRATAIGIGGGGSGTRRFPSTSPSDTEGETTLAEVFPAELETPEDATVTQEFVNRISECMEKLASKHREILILRNIKNLSYEEIADILGISIGTVKSRIARARESLRAKMGDEFK